MTANVTIVGNLTSDPELRFTPAGAPVTTFGVAVNRRWQNRDSQQWEESTSFFNVTCWRDLAQTQEGERRSVVEIVADEVGPSLRWATATVNRNERRDASGNGWSGGSGGGGTGGGGGSSRPVSNEPPSYDPSEEPF